MGIRHCLTSLTTKILPTDINVCGLKTSKKAFTPQVVKKLDFRFVERRFLAANNHTGSAEGALVPVLLRDAHCTKSGFFRPASMFQARGFRMCVCRVIRFSYGAAFPFSAH